MRELQSLNIYMGLRNSLVKKNMFNVIINEYITLNMFGWLVGWKIVQHSEQTFLSKAEPQ